MLNGVSRMFEMDAKAPMFASTVVSQTFLFIVDLKQSAQCWRPPRLGPTTRTVAQGEMAALVGPITQTKYKLEIRNNSISTPVTVSGYIVTLNRIHKCNMQ